ncbi:hypothetical protein [Winogradskyella pulchriflava]|uniref:RteC protein n=1 Tax=Winogradskyella pulchriflava TaxID=1110688 RepID=A0ABV6Q8J4_9FLAO
MDEIILYKNHYKAIKIKAKHIIIALFKKHSSDRRPFNFFYPKIIERVDKYRDTFYSKLYSTKYVDAYEFFERRGMHYKASKDEVITLIFQNDIAPLFENFPTKKYESFIIAMARKEAIHNLFLHLDNFYDYYRLVYETESFQYIYLKGFDNLDFRDSKEYHDMLDIKYPNRMNSQANIEMKLPKEDDNSKTSSSKNDKDSEIQNKLNDFTDDERMIIGYLIYENYLKSKKRSITFNKFLLLVKIIGGYEELSIFYQKTNSNTLYKKGNEGPKYFAESSQVKLLNSLLFKLGDLGIDDISPLIRKELRKLK